MVLTINPRSMELCWREVDAYRILEVEKLITKNLPYSFKSMVSLCDAGCPTEDCFIFFDKSLKRYSLGDFGSLLAFSEDYPYEKFIDHYYHPPEFFCEGLIGFSVDGCGNLLCFDYRQDPATDDPPIVFWNHESPEDVSPVAPNFDAFLNMLTTEEEAVAEMNRLNAELKKSGE